MNPSFPQEALRALLALHPHGLTEHAILKHFRQSIADPLDLYQAHFALFHALYRLQDTLREQQRAEVHIDPLCIALRPYVSGSDALQTSDPLREYYLDERNSVLTREQVVALLTGFRAVHHRAPHPQRSAALALLGLRDPVDWPTIKRRYRQLAMRHHPDRGGCTKTLQALHEALHILREGN